MHTSGIRFGLGRAGVRLRLDRAIVRLGFGRVGARRERPVLQGVGSRVGARVNGTGPGSPSPFCRARKSGQGLRG